MNTETAPNVIKEGGAEILIQDSKNVFYNPVQEFNRDLSVAVLTHYAAEHHKRILDSRKKTLMGDKLLTAGAKFEEGVTILEAFSATGLRSIRYAREVPGVKRVLANDISELAVKSITANIAHNQVQGLVFTSHNDAAMVMYEHRKQTERFHCVDLDPYGCPSAFLDGAVQCVREEGVLLVTCTDMALLCGNTPETCHAKYGAISLKSKACHEMVSNTFGWAKVN